MSYAPKQRVIIDAPPEDFSLCLELARESLKYPNRVRSIMGYWSSGDPNFEAVVRVNKASVSVTAVRKMPEGSS